MDEPVKKEMTFQQCEAKKMYIQPVSSDATKIFFVVLTEGNLSAPKNLGP